MARGTTTFVQLKEQQKQIIHKTAAAAAVVSTERGRVDIYIYIHLEEPFYRWALRDQLVFVLLGMCKCTIPFQCYSIVCPR